MHEGKNFIFHHIPKTGGTSIVDALHKDGLLDYSGMDLHDGRIVHKPLSINQNKYKFCFVRNPFDRLVSVYHWATQGSWYNHKQTDKTIQVIIDIDFEHWFYATVFNFEFDPKDFKIIDKDSSLGVSEEQAIRITLQINSSWNRTVFFIPQYQYIGNTKQNLDFIGRFEQLDSDWEIIRKQIGCSTKLDNLIKSDRKDYKEYYSPAMQKVVKRMYYDDFKMFDYDW